jgi:hypothetical protein
MHRTYLALVLLVVASLAQPAQQVGAQMPPPGDPSQAMVPISQIIRQAGYTLSDAEATYLDAEQQLQAQYLAPMLQVMALAGGPEAGVPSDATQAGIVAELQKVVALDPGAAPEAPTTLQRLRELAVLQRVGLRRVAEQWLEALQGGDPDWRTRGASDFQAAQQSLADWQQELASRYPPPAPAQP